MLGCRKVLSAAQNSEDWGRHISLDQGVARFSRSKTNGAFQIQPCAPLSTCSRLRWHGLGTSRRGSSDEGTVQKIRSSDPICQRLAKRGQFKIVDKAVRHCLVIQEISRPDQEPPAGGLPPNPCSQIQGSSPHLERCVAFF